MKLTTKQRQIVEKIRLLHGQKLPLNISAVKRHHPKLLEQVMTLKHFRGWRKALEAAKLSYSKIKIELLDHCSCAVCGEKLQTLESHLRNKHRMSKERYRRKFPDEPTESDQLRAQRTGALRKAPHWEPVWSREYLIDYLIYKHEHGEDLSPWKIYQDEPKLHGIIKKYFGSYREGIEAAGIDYREVRVIDLTEKWTPAKVIERIQKLHKAKPLASSSDIRRRDSRLYDRCHRYFGGPVPAIEAAGILYIEMKSRRSRQWTRNNVIHTIRSLAKHGHALHEAAVTQRLNGHADELFAMADDHFGSWTNAVTAAKRSAKQKAAAPSY